MPRIYSYSIAVGIEVTTAPENYEGIKSSTNPSSYKEVQKKKKEKNETQLKIRRGRERMDGVHVVKFALMDILLCEPRKLCVFYINFRINLMKKKPSVEIESFDNLTRT